jgi:hypothetical protein
MGVNGMDRARLRLLLGEAGPSLRVPWRLGTPEQADVLLVAPGSLEAEAGALRARGRGVRCVNLGGPGEVGDDFLPDGFSVDDLAHVLNAASPPDASQFQTIDAMSPDFFGAEERGQEPNPSDGVPEAVDLERYLRRDSGEYSIDRLVPYRLDDTISLEPATARTDSARAQARSSERDPFDRKQQADQGLIDPEARRRAPAPGRTTATRQPLASYLDGHVLMVPSVIVLADAEPLILDPKNNQYMISGDLKSAEPYVQTPLAASDFDRLTTRELERWRALCEAHPYRRLRWLIALRAGDGWLPRHLDPGGSYHLRDSLSLDSDYAPQARVAQVLTQWRRLHEVAAEAEVEMQAVFDTVAAFDAIGWLEWRPRERRR